MRSPIELPDGALRVDATLTRTGVFVYRDSAGNEIREYRPAEEVFDQVSLDSFEGVVVTDDHPPVMIDASNVDTYKRGRLASVKRDGANMIGTLIVEDEALKAKLRAGKRDISHGYICDLEMKSGVSPDGEKYDAIQRSIRGNHTAVVDAGRAGNARAKMDRFARFDAAAVQVMSNEYSSACVYITSKLLSLDALKKRVAELLTATQKTVDADFAALPAAVVDVSAWCSAAQVTVRSDTLSADELLKLVLAALASAPELSVHKDSAPASGTPALAGAHEKSTGDQRKDSTVDLKEALAKIDALTTERETQKRRADDAEAKVKETETKLAQAQAKADAAANDLKTAKEAAEKADKARTDAIAAQPAAVKARVALVGTALASGVTSIKVADKDVSVYDAEPRDVRLAVIAKLDGAEVPADKRDNDAYIEARFDLATAKADQSRVAFNALNPIVNAPARHDNAPDGDDKEEKARAKMREDSRNAHNAPLSMTREEK